MALILPISAFQAPAHHVCCIPFLPLAPTFRSTPLTISTKIPTLCFRHCKLALVVSAMGDGETELPVSGRGLEEEERGRRKNTEQSLSGNLMRTFRGRSSFIALSNSEGNVNWYLIHNIKLTIMIEDPRDVEQKKLFGIEDPTKLTRDDMVAALEDVHEGRIPKNRVALQLLAQEMLNWPELEIEAPKSSRSKSLYAKVTETGVNAREAAKRLSIDWDSAAEIEEETDDGDIELPPPIGLGALYLVTAFPVIIGISVVLILFYNSLQ
ncbi:hypothetical protein HPP92_001492 [Vanilla planifolia]|uniref:Ycf3-interacting protein 1, chloroplastic n=1 Tax=Vanilla planifolia TaxID=51239 RepID=A0A835S6Q6_VANPL|nr:hypothetical protein HPP92_001585 [Vanilla planifolia]KAG0501420.1 hypothetical protein HPP92_001492 [Vanilla planifolia]